MIESAFVGDVACSDWLLVDQERIDRFADVTCDRQDIHVDPKRAAGGPFAGTIAHGFLMLSLLPALRASTPSSAPLGVRASINYGGNKVRFVTPVRSGKRVRARQRLLSAVERRSGEQLYTYEITVEIEGETSPALVAEWMTLHLTGPSPAP